ncbi:MAG TPA: hypothetical protein VFP96_12450 [Candidatus Acidoferrum sp.]|jgi:hypothetical protein|nr:hypothetical protein [Candidatus Acidoferrum sp.]
MGRLKPIRTKTDAFELYLEFLRYALAKKIRPMRVIPSEPAPSPWPGTGVSLARVLIEINGIPVIERKDGVPISARRVTEFFESWELQEYFIRWLGRRIAKVVPRTAVGKKLRKSFAHLATGRMGKLPPRMFLQVQYDRLVWEIKQMKEQFALSFVPTEKQREAIFEFGRNTSASWLPYLQGRLDLFEIFPETPAAAAELILSERYDCEREAIHSWLFRSRRLVKK